MRGLAAIFWGLAIALAVASSALWSVPALAAGEPAAAGRTEPSQFYEFDFDEAAPPAGLSPPTSKPTEAQALEELFQPQPLASASWPAPAVPQRGPSLPPEARRWLLSPDGRLQAPRDGEAGNGTLMSWRYAYEAAQPPLDLTIRTAVFPKVPVRR